MREHDEATLWDAIGHAEGADRAELLACMAQQHFTNGRGSQALLALDAACELFETAGRHRDAAQSHHNAGVVLLVLDRPEEAVERHRLAVRLFQEDWCEPQAGACERHIAELEAAAGHHGAALTTLRQTAARLVTAEEWREWGRCRFAEAGLLFTLGKKDAAATALLEARARLIGESDEVAACDLLLVRVEIARRRYSEAEEALDRCTAVFEAIGDDQELDGCRFRRAQLLVRTGDHAGALALLDELRLERQQRGDVAGVGRCHLEAARAMRRLGERDAAMKLTRDAVSVAEASGDEAGRAKALLVQAKLWLDASEAQRAVDCREHAAQLFAAANRPGDARRARTAARRVLRARRG